MRTTRGCPCFRQHDLPPIVHWICSFKLKPLRFQCRLPIFTRKSCPTLLCQRPSVDATRDDVEEAACFTGTETILPGWLVYLTLLLLEARV